MDEEWRIHKVSISIDSKVLKYHHYFYSHYRTLSKKVINDLKKYSLFNLINTGLGLMIELVRSKYIMMTMEIGYIMLIWRMFAMILRTIQYWYIIQQIQIYLNLLLKNVLTTLIRVYSLAIFYWTGIKFENLNQSFPVNTFYTYEDEGIWILSIERYKHVAHFFESISVPFNAMLRPNFFKGPVYSSFLL